jgi:cephalosporin hydroxylase
MNENQMAVRDFHRTFYEEKTRRGETQGLHALTPYHGIETHKCPLDLWIFQEMLHDVRPALVIELGTFLGGTTLFLAHQLELLNCGSVVSVDCRELSRPQHPRVQYLVGNTESTEIVGKIRLRAQQVSGPVLVIHDADHHYDVCLEDLETYGPFVTAGSYLIVEDTNVNGHPVNTEWGPGPWEAVETFLSKHSEFVRDSGRDKFLMTYNPGGHLRRCHSSV